MRRRKPLYHPPVLSFSILVLLCFFSNLKICHIRSLVGSLCDLHLYTRSVSVQFELPFIFVLVSFFELFLSNKFGSASDMVYPFQRTYIMAIKDYLAL